MDASNKQKDMVGKMESIINLCVYTDRIVCAYAVISGSQFSSSFCRIAIVSVDLKASIVICIDYIYVELRVYN